MKIAVFRDVTPCGLVIVWYKMGAAGSSETLVSLSKLNTVTCRKTTLFLFAAMRTSNFSWFILAYDRI